MTDKEIATELKRRFKVDRDPGYICSVRNGSRRSVKLKDMIDKVLKSKQEGGKA